MKTTQPMEGGAICQEESKKIRRIVEIITVAILFLNDTEGEVKGTGVAALKRSHGLKTRSNQQRVDLQ